MLKKSEINKGNAMNYLASIVRIVRVCVEKQSAVKPRDAWKKRSLHSLWSVEGIPNAPYPSPTDSPTDSPTPKISFHFSSWYQFLFVYFIFENLILHIFLIIIIIIRCSGMFRDVPCSWFYRRPVTTPHYPIFVQLSVHRSLTGGSRTFQIFSSKSGRGRLREVVAFKRF